MSAADNADAEAAEARNIRRFQLVQTHPVELIAGEWSSLRWPLPAPPVLPAAQTLDHEVVHLVELPVGIPRPEIVPPAAKHGRQFRDDLLHFLPALPLAGQLSYAVPEFLRRLRARPPLHEMPARVSLDAPLLANRASQEYEALLPASQVHHPRLHWMQRQTRAGPSPARSAEALPSLPIPCGTSPPDHRRIGPVSQAGYIAPPRSDPTCSGRCWPATARSLRPAGFPPAFPSPSHPPSLPLPTIGGLTSIPFDPRSAPSPTPSGSPSGCCQSSLECLHRRRSCVPGCLLLGSLPGLVSRSSSVGIHNCSAGSPPRRSAPSPSSPPSAPLDPAPSVSPMAAASHLLSVCIAASPGKDDIGLPAALPESPPETPPALVVRWPGSSPRLPLPRRRCCALASMLPTERHSCRSGRTTHGTAVSYSAWHTPIACVGVVVLFHRGFWPFPACPRTYLLTSMIKARPLPSSALSCTPSSVLRTSRTPSRLRALSAIRPYTPGLCPTRLPGRVSPVPRCSVPTCHRLRPRGGPASVPFQDAVCCLRRDMSGSALPNTFRLII